MLYSKKIEIFNRSKFLLFVWETWLFFTSHMAKMKKTRTCSSTPKRLFTRMIRAPCRQQQQKNLHSSHRLSIIVFSRGIIYKYLKYSCTKKRNNKTKGLRIALSQTSSSTRKHRLSLRRTDRDRCAPRAPTPTLLALCHRAPLARRARWRRPSIML